jgi:hypothetical protein
MSMATAWMRKRFRFSRRQKGNKASDPNGT